MDTNTDGRVRTWLSQTMFNSIQWKDKNQWAQTKIQHILLNISFFFFFKVVIEFWIRLPREAGDSSTLEILNIQLDTFLSNLGKGVGQTISRGPCQTQLLYSSVCNLRDEYPKRNRSWRGKKCSIYICKQNHLRWWQHSLPSHELALTERVSSGINHIFTPAKWCIFHSWICGCRESNAFEELWHGYILFN